jgi:hypothetical protein
VLSALLFVVELFASAPAVAGASVSARDAARAIDLTSFPNSTGPRRIPGAKTPTDYGFTIAEEHGDGVDLYLADRSWLLGVRVLTQSGRTLVLCIQDKAENGGSYHTIDPVEFERRSDGLLHATGRHVTDRNCPAYRG